MIKNIFFLALVLALPVQAGKLSKKQYIRNADAQTIQFIERSITEGFILIHPNSTFNKDQSRGMGGFIEGYISVLGLLRHDKQAATVLVNLLAYKMDAGLSESRSCSLYNTPTILNALKKMDAMQSVQRCNHVFNETKKKFPKELIKLQPNLICHSVEYVKKQKKEWIRTISITNNEHGCY